MLKHSEVILMKQFYPGRGRECKPWRRSRRAEMIRNSYVTFMHTGVFEFKSQIKDQSWRSFECSLLRLLSRRRRRLSLFFMAGVNKYRK